MRGRSKLEKGMERTLCERLESARGQRSILEEIRITSPTSDDVGSLGDLIGGAEFDVWEDNSD